MCTLCMHVIHIIFLFLPWVLTIVILKNQCSHMLINNLVICPNVIIHAMIIFGNAAWSNFDKLHWNNINYHVLIFTQVAPLSPLTFPCFALPYSIREASLVRTGGKAAHTGANGSHKAAVLIARTLHTDPPNHSTAASSWQFESMTQQTTGFSNSI